MSSSPADQQKLILNHTLNQVDNLMKPGELEVPVNTNEPKYCSCNRVEMCFIDILIINFSFHMGKCWHVTILWYFYYFFIYKIRFLFKIKKLLS